MYCTRLVTSLHLTLSIVLDTSCHACTYSTEHLWVADMSACMYAATTAPRALHCMHRCACAIHVEAMHTAKYGAPSDSVSTCRITAVKQDPACLLILNRMQQAQDCTSEAGMVLHRL